MPLFFDGWNGHHVITVGVGACDVNDFRREVVRGGKRAKSKADS